MIQRVVIINDRSEAIGGASHLALLAARLLKNRGIAVTFFAGDGQTSAALSRSQPDLVQVGGRPLSQQNAASAFLTGLYNGQTARRMREWIREHDQPGIVYHVHGWSKVLSPSLFHALTPVADRVLLHAHDYFLACPNGGFTNYRTGLVCELQPMSRACLTTQCDKRSYAQKLWRCARQIVRDRGLNVRTSSVDVLLIHPAMAPYFERFGIARERMHAVRNPVEPLVPEGTKAQQNRSYFFVGRLEPEKGFIEAAEAARRASVPLEVIGDGPGRSQIEQRYPEVLIHGWKQRRELGSAISRARAVIIASRVPEPFSLIALEVLTSGIPVVITDIALIADEVASNGMGLAFKAGDAEACARALERLARDDQLVEALSQRAREGAHALANTPERWCDALIARYQATLERAGTARHAVVPGPRRRPEPFQSASGNA